VPPYIWPLYPALLILFVPPALYLWLHPGNCVLWTFDLKKYIWPLYFVECRQLIQNGYSSRIQPQKHANISCSSSTEVDAQRLAYVHVKMADSGCEETDAMQKSSTESSVILIWIQLAEQRLRPILGPWLGQETRPPAAILVGCMYIAYLLGFCWWIQEQHILLFQ